MQEELLIMNCDIPAEDLDSMLTIRKAKPSNAIVIEFMAAETSNLLGG